MAPSLSRGTVDLSAARRNHKEVVRKEALSGMIYLG